MIGDSLYRIEDTLEDEDLTPELRKKFEKNREQLLKVMEKEYDEPEGVYESDYDPEEDEDDEDD